MIEGKYWDCNDLLSYNCNLSVVNGKRSIGKSYGQLTRAISRRVRNHEAMVWLRMTGEDAGLLAKQFGSDKWTAILDKLGVDRDNVRRQGNRILWRPYKSESWQPMIRYAGLSEWANLRDTDDPSEKFIYFDEYIVPDSKLRRYTGGRPAENLIDLWLSLRRGSNRCPILCAGNPELGTDWLLPGLGIRDRQDAEKIRIYRPSEDIRDKCRDEVFNLERVAVLWTTNPGGQSAGGEESGTAGRVPDGLLRRRSGSEVFYSQFDLGDGPFSLWYTRDGGLICDSREAPKEKK